MKRRFLLVFALIGLAVASAKSYTVQLSTPAMLGGSELQAGEYQLTIQGDKAVLRNGKIDATATVKVETAPAKFRTTSTLLDAKDGKKYITAIQLGGTTTRLVFGD